MEPESAIQRFKNALEKTIIKDEDGEWYASFSTNCTIFSKENMRIDTVEINGKGDFSKQVVITIYFRINKSCQVKIKRWDARNVEEGIKNIFEFTNTYSICIDCGLILYKDTPCYSCEFFKSFLKYNQIPDRECAICQDVVHRTQLSCGHVFHYTCLTKLEPVAAKCPICRTDLNAEEVEEIFYRQDEDSESESDEDEE